MPAAMATVVMTMGRDRSRQALIKASRWLRPARSSMMANSTSRMEFFDAKPSSMSRPISTGRSSCIPITWIAANAPKVDSGRADRMVTGLKKLPNNSTSTP